MYRGKRPPNDDAYFETMSRVIFEAGLNWDMIEKKWPNFRNAFEGFSVEKVSRYGDAEISRLMKDEGIVRNRAKITAVVQNAAQFIETSRHYGSFQSYLSSLDKSDNYAPAMKELSKRFKRLGPSSASIFLFAVGEDIHHSQET